MIVQPHLPILSGDFVRANSDYLSKSSAQFNYNRSKIAFSFWFKRRNTTAQVLAIVSKWNSGGVGANSAFRIRIQNDHRIEIEIVKELQTFPVTYASDIVRYNTIYNDTNWHHILITAEPTVLATGSRYALWSDGNSDTIFSSLIGASNGGMPDAASTDVEIGSMTASQFWTGQLYQVAAFSHTGALPSISDVYDSANAWPKDITTVPGLFSIANCDLFNVAEDAFLADWTINNTPSTSTTIPVV